MLLGQRDMLELEVEYHLDEVKKFAAWALISLAVCVTLAYIYYPF